MRNVFESKIRSLPKTNISNVYKKIFNKSDDLVIVKTIGHYENTLTYQIVNIFVSEGDVVFVLSNEEKILCKYDDFKKNYVRNFNKCEYFIYVNDQISIEIVLSSGTYRKYFK